MKAVTLFCHAVAGAVIFTAAAVGAVDKQQDKLQLRIDEPQSLQHQDLNRDRSRLHQEAPLYAEQQQPPGDQIYGAALMTADEQMEYRNQYRKLQTVEEQNRFENRHRLLIRTRAQAENVSVPTQTKTQMQQKTGATVNNRTSGSTMSGNRGSNSSSGSMRGDQGGGNQSSGGGAGSGNGGSGGSGGSGKR